MNNEEFEKKEAAGDSEFRQAGENDRTPDRDSISGEEDEGNGKSHRMVEVGRQPGMMEYPFATHGPPPGSSEEGAEDSEEGVSGAGLSEGFMTGDNISAAFVVGVLVVLAVLFIGLMFAAQRNQINNLQNEIDAIQYRLDMLENRL